MKAATHRRIALGFLVVLLAYAGSDPTSSPATAPASQALSTDTVEQTIATVSPQSTPGPGTTAPAYKDIQLPASAAGAALFASTDSRAGALFAQFGSPFINAAGTLVFWARRVDNRTTGIYTLSTGGTLHPVAEADEYGTAPLLALSKYPSINAAGDVAFRALESGYPRTGAIYATAAGRLVRVARDGDVATGTVPGARFAEVAAGPFEYEIYRRTLINRNGMVVFDARVATDDPYSPYSEAKGVWSWTAARGLRPVMVTGALPPAPANSLELSWIYEYDLNGDDQVAVHGTCGATSIYSPPTYHAIWSGPVNGTLAITDIVFAEIYGGGPYLGGPFLASAGAAGVHRMEVQNYQMRNTQRITGTGAILNGGEFAPGSGDLEFAYGWSPIPTHGTMQVGESGPVLSDDRQALVLHNLYDAEEIHNDGPTDGIWYRSSAGALYPLVLAGQSLAPWTLVPGDVVRCCAHRQDLIGGLSSNIAMDRMGRIAFTVDAERPSRENPAVMEAGLALFARASFGAPTKLVTRTGDKLFVGSLKRQFKVSSLDWGTGQAGRRDNARSGHGIMNDGGVIAYRVDVADAESGIVGQAICRSAVN